MASVAVPATSGIAATRAAEVCGPPYVKDRSELGPKLLPRTGYFGSLVRGYVRYGLPKRSAGEPAFRVVRKRSTRPLLQPPDNGYLAVLY